ncbi:MAG: ARPP-1 family domain-containing protein [Burkholderiales bacterium]
MNPIQSALSRLSLGQAQAFANMALFPLIAAHVEAPDYLVLEEALKSDVGRITEISEGGRVPELAFENNAPARVLLVDGEELIGARQNRVLNISILVPAGKKLAIPVSCCEQGRWRYTGSREFASSDSALFARAKAKKMLRVSESMRSHGERRSDQDEIWDDIAMKSARLKVESGTSAMADVYAQHRARLDGYVSAFALQPGQSGAVVAIDGKVAGLELFDSPATFGHFFQKLLRSFALDAIDVEEPVTSVPAAEIAKAFLEHLAAASAETFAALGDGEDVRLHGPDVVAGALVADGRVRHLAGFRTEGLEEEALSWRARKVRARQHAGSGIQ